jgi:hypothetical protein
MIGTDILDLRQNTSSGGGSVPQSIINIIEQNTGTQYNVKVLHSEITWANGVPTRVEKYTDSGKGTKVYDNTITWVGGVPTTIVSNNLDDGIITTTNIVWSNGVPISITKTEG